MRLLVARCEVVYTGRLTDSHVYKPLNCNRKVFRAEGGCRWAS